MTRLFLLIVVLIASTAPLNALAQNKTVPEKAGQKTEPYRLSDEKKIQTDLYVKGMNWLLPINHCPADVAGKETPKGQYNFDRCVDNLSQCMAKCKKGYGWSCMNAALVSQKLERRTIANALFSRSCELGVASGCTNRAAGMSAARYENQACIKNTFRVACELDDAWGCTKYGAHVLESRGEERDTKKARQALEKACTLHDNSQPCRQAKALIVELETELKKVTE